MSDRDWKARAEAAEASLADCREDRRTLIAEVAERDRIIAEKDKALEPFAKFAGDLSALKQRFFLQLLVCPEGDSCPEDYGPHFHAARAARDLRAS